ncbi:hypothetical protein [Cupriavidus sp. DL-D2]|uniref:hypothetical protein n=1 Tax=Cupriavidus sp. DL-D2 TaxID=3144974 RepID=UPI003215C210
MTAALHRVQDLGAASARFHAQERLRLAVSVYLSWRDVQIDAVEDGNTSLASAIGRDMKALRENFGRAEWDRELNRVTEGQS